jgi:hypothetical protein
MPKNKQDKNEKEKQPYDRFEELARQVFSVPLSKVKPDKETDDNDNKQSKRKRRKRQ